MGLVQECPFCNLGTRVITENKYARIFLSDPRKVKGHFLIVPKRHVTEPWKLSKDEVADIFELVLLAQRRLREYISPGSDVMQHYRPFMPEGRIKVHHIHYHVIPRDFNDIIYQRVEKYEVASHYEDLPSDEKEEMTRLLIG